ncbi:MAG: response regulator transcription factor [Phycisphaeraceae bacterium]|nr:response regulator transcription factor [Phycisphaeraceae bacterium]
MAGETILIVEDEPAMRRGLRDNFELAGYRVALAADGEAGLRAAVESRPDLIVLDIMLPKVNGYEICRLIRGQGLTMPIVMLTAKGEESDIVLGLNLGADDYLTKPFSVRELLARCEAHLRRAREPAGKTYAFGTFELDVASRRLLREGEAVELTPKEYALLELLVRRTGRAMTRDEILRQVWGYNVFVTGRSVDRCVNTLRKKIEDDPARPRWVVTLREVGYRFDVEVNRSVD